VKAHVASDGPALAAIPFGAGGDSLVKQLLTPRQRQLLESLSTRVNLPARATVYREHGPATVLYICGEGALRAYRDLPSGRRRVTSFMFAKDVFGLAQAGRFVNTVQAMTPSLCYRIPLEQLTVVLKSDAELQFHFLCKAVHELRSLQYRTIILGRRSAPGRIAMFLVTIGRRVNLEAGHEDAGHPMIELPMSRSDIAAYLGLTLESVSRAGRKLIDAGIVAWAGPHRLRVLDEKRLQSLAADV
jgi:CRP/FNR family transcriptional regulator